MRMWSFLHRRAAIIACSLLLLAALPISSAEAERSHAISMHGTPKYTADFAQLDYVNSAAPKGGVLRLAKTGSFDNLNANIITGTPAEGLEHLNDRLMQRVWDEPFTMYGLVAGAIDVSDDRSRITFYLRPEARFHDGKPMTADDVRYSFEMFRDHGHPVRRRVYGLVNDVTIIDAHTISFTFGEGYDRESVMILAMLPVLPKHYWEEQDITKTTLQPPLGSGPYQITRVEPGRKITYERVKDWWAKDLPVMRGQHNFDTISYTYFRDDDVAVQSLLSGGYDVRREYDINNWTTLADAKPVADGRLIRAEIKHQRPEWLKAMIFNSRRAPFDDLRVRTALGLMFNADWVNQSLYGGALRRLNSSFSNSELAATGEPDTAELAVLQPWRAQIDPAVFGTAWQPPAGSARERQRAAIKLMADAGWHIKNQKMVDAQGRALSFEILLSDPRDEKIALSFARDLERIGVSLRVRTVDSAQFTGRLEAFDYDMVIFRWINSLSPGNEQVNYWGSAAAANRGSRNYGGVANPAVDSLADAIARTTRREDLVANCRALDRVLMHGHYFVPLFYIGRDLVAHDAGIAKPDSAPMYGTVLESWWKKAAE